MIHNLITLPHHRGNFSQNKIRYSVPGEYHKERGQLEAIYILFLHSETQGGFLFRHSETRRVRVAKGLLYFVLAYRDSRRVFVSAWRVSRRARAAEGALYFIPALQDS